MHNQFARLCIVSVSAVILFASFSEDEKKRAYRQVPAGCVRLSENFFCDDTEVANVHWREFMYWTNRTFGDSSDEIKAILPDTTVWSDDFLLLEPLHFLCLNPYIEYYLRHPSYDYYPVVGVTQQQVQAFCKWRADRVFEKMLVDAGIIAEREQNGNDYFTIEKYFNGIYPQLRTDKALQYYPEYALPTCAEREMILKMADSIEYKRGTKPAVNSMYVEIVPCKRDTSLKDPTRSIYDKKGNKFRFADLRGNVGEWAAEPNVTFGGGWIDSKDRIAQSDTFNTAGANAWTGFRNVCRWKKWEGTRD